MPGQTGADKFRSFFQDHQALFPVRTLDHPAAPLLDHIPGLDFVPELEEGTVHRHFRLFIPRPGPEIPEGFFFIKLDPQVSHTSSPFSSG